jgi:hypothetical protein
MHAPAGATLAAMPSRKQRRRRQKERRHEYEYVYVDDEGREVEVEEAELEAARRRASQNGRPRTVSSGRQIQPPSWARVLKRALIFAPLMFLTVTFLGGGLTVVQRVVQTVWLLAIFVPFSYLLDRVMYRRFTKREAGGAPAESARRR